MWNPGFAHEAFEPARARRLEPGLVRLLDPLSRHARATGPRARAAARAARCIGRAIGVAPEREAEVTAYLDARELLDVYVYERVRLPLRLLGGGERGRRPGATSPAPSTSTMPGGLDRTLGCCDCVRQGHGLAGACADYVRNTVAHLREMRIGEPELERIVDRAVSGPSAR